MDVHHTRVPIIKLWNQLVVPLQGEITDDLAEVLTQDVLERIRVSDADGLVIDLTGVWMLDSHLCAMLSSLAASAGLMGTQTVLCGMNPETAMTLQTMGVGMQTRTALTLESALAMQGIRLHGEENDGESDEPLPLTRGDLDGLVGSMGEP
ncbi:MAG: STAS domain-containing protein [Myxococcota bacterium]